MVAATIVTVQASARDLRRATTMNSAVCLLAVFGAFATSSVSANRIGLPSIARYFTDIASADGHRPS